MKRHFLLMGLLAAVSGGVAVAQPEQGGAAITPNPPNAGGPQTPEQKQAQMEAIMKKAQEEGAAMMKLPPDQMRAKLREMQATALRMEMNRTGFADVALQDRLVKFIEEQEKSREDLRTAGFKLYTAVTTPGAATTDQGLTALLEDYIGAVDEAKAAREKASTVLDADIGWSKKPKLRAFLVLKGFIGEDSWMAEDLLTGGNMALMGFSQWGKTAGK